MYSVLDHVNYLITGKLYGARIVESILEWYIYTYQESKHTAQCILIQVHQYQKTSEIVLEGYTVVHRV